jgi:hypothetical protein
MILRYTTSESVPCCRVVIFDYYSGRIITWQRQVSIVSMEISPTAGVQKRVDCNSVVSLESGVSKMSNSTSMGSLRSSGDSAVSNQPTSQATKSCLLYRQMEGHITILLFIFDIIVSCP